MIGWHRRLARIPVPASTDGGMGGMLLPRERVVAQGPDRGEGIAEANCIYADSATSEDEGVLVLVDFRRAARPRRTFPVLIYTAEDDWLVLGAELRVER